ncbi:MAG: hypothetical protein QGF56_06310 [Verrucomicrobiota bacterium]|nr:hypothetical protein [Verrucomicrobiota bacterium]MDP7050271.1 hypothetical protein [Verrucomicrobiota bacterium]
MKNKAKTAVTLSICLLVGWVCVPDGLAEKARFYSSNGPAAIKSRTEEILPGAGQSSLSRAKSLSGVGTVRYPGSAPTLDRATTQKLLELFDKKKNWMFQDLGEENESGDEVEEWSLNGNLIGSTENARRNPYGNSRGVVQDFLRSGDKEKRSRKNSKRRNRPELLSEEEEEEKLAEPKFELNEDEFKEGGKKKEPTLILADSPFAAKMALADFSPFSSKRSRSVDPFKALQNREAQKGGRLLAGQALGQAGAAPRPGFFQQKNKNGGGLITGKNLFNTGTGGLGKRALGLDPMSFGGGLATKPSTPVTGLAAGGSPSVFKLPAGLAAPTLANRPSSSGFGGPSSATRRETPLLFQAREWQPPSTRSGLLQQRSGASSGKPPRGF